jgi:diaminopimelate epimerase
MVTLSEKNKKDWDLVVYERGAGLTQCCGSGATASRIAIESAGLVSKETDFIFFHMPGGTVHISKKEMAEHMQWILQGQAEFVFSGTLL